MTEKIAKFILKLILKLILISLGFFIVTFIVYFFNLDMKLTAAMEPVLEFFYGKVKRDTHL